MYSVPDEGFISIVKFSSRKMILNKTQKQDT